MEFFKLLAFKSRAVLLFPRDCQSNNLGPLVITELIQMSKEVRKTGFI